MGMLRDDPVGHFAAGYNDGAAGKKFNPPAEQVTKAAVSKKAVKSTATDLEKAWYGLCNSSKFIPKHIVDYYVSALNAEGNHVAVAVGLHDFTFHICPKCKEEGQFRIHFLGRLEHPDCQWSGYMGTGSYIGFQLMQILHSGMRAGSQMKEDAKRPDDKGSSWINAVFGFLFVGIFRAALAVMLIPLHTIVAVFQPGQTGTDIAKRIAAMVVFLAVVAFGVYKIQTADRQRFQPTPVGPSGGSSQNMSTPAAYGSYYVIVERCHACAWDNWQADTLAPLANAGFRALTGSLRNGTVVPEPVTSWATYILVGPFTDAGSAQTALQRIESILKPVALAKYDQSNLFHDEISGQQAAYAGYMTRVLQ